MTSKMVRWRGREAGGGSDAAWATLRWLRCDARRRRWGRKWGGGAIGEEGRKWSKHGDEESTRNSPDQLVEA